MSFEESYEAVNRICFVLRADARAVRGPRRWQSLAGVRKRCARYLRWRGCSYPEIGRAMGGRHHTTVLNWLGRLA